MNRYREVSDCDPLQNTDETFEILGACCPICKEGTPTPWRSISQYEYLRCKACGLAYLERRPEPALLENFYNTSFQVDRDSQAKKIGRKSSALLRILARALPEKGKVLELGSSYGHFLRRAQQAGWDVEGVEISRSAADWARQTFGILAHAGTLEGTLPVLRPPYDAVVMLHVLEHSSDPRRLISQVREILRPGGVLLVETPNSSSWIARECGRTWEWLTLPAHIFLFSPASMRHLLEGAGFSVEILTTQRGDAHNSFFEITRALTKRIFSGSAQSLDSGRGPSRTGWYHSLEVASDFFYRPFEPVENFFLSRQLTHPELLAVARRSDLQLGQ
jgi:SAM-dependent methyltransferase